MAKKTMHDLYEVEVNRETWSFVYDAGTDIFGPERQLLIRFPRRELSHQEVQMAIIGYNKGFANGHVVGNREVQQTIRIALGLSGGLTPQPTEDK